MIEKKYKLGVFYGTDTDTVKLARRFVGHLINNKEFCTACELLEQKVKCDHCRERLRSHARDIYFFDQIGKNAPTFIEEPESFLPKTIPPINFLMVIGIHQDILSELPVYLKEKGVKAVIIPIEDPKWIPAGLQVQVLREFEKVGIEAAFPKPFCSLSKELNEYNKIGFHITKSRKYINEFIDYYQIGEPIVSLLLSKDGQSIEDGCILQCAPCGSTFYIVQQLKAKYFKNGKSGELSLNERISKAHHSFPCSASMDQDTILKDSPLHIAGYLIRNAIRRELGLKEEKGLELSYIIK